MDEIWKPVKWYEWIYEISNLWRIKSLSRFVHNKEWLPDYKIPERIVWWWNNWNWYLFVTLYKDWLYKRMYIHRLVAIAFIDNPENLPQVNHKDWNKENNCVDNLEWCDNSYNNKHSFEFLWRKRMKWKNNPKSKLIDVYKDWVLVYSWYSTREVWKAMWVCWDSVWRCCVWQYKQAGWYVFKYR